MGWGEARLAPIDGALRCFSAIADFSEIVTGRFRVIEQVIEQSDLERRSGDRRYSLCGALSFTTWPSV
jgi:hypothetical protein